MRTVVTLLLLVLAAPAAAADFVVHPGPALPSSPGLPACDDPKVLGDIVERQHWAEANTWRDGVRIEEIGSISQRYATTKFTSAIEHRHCEAQAYLGPRRTDRLYYVISREMGFASISWYVDFCMPKHDPYRVYNADCRVLK
jgi:hypothetical protein